MDGAPRTRAIDLDPAEFALGLEVCLEDPPEILRSARFGLLLNQASLDRAFRPAHELLSARFPSQLRALFGPQHGLFLEQQDDMIETPHARDTALGVPVHSLYSEHRQPTPPMLDGLDLLVVDLQDVGTRVYTYVWTLLHCLEACAERGIPVLVLDRPNPLGGAIVEGPRLDPAFKSFVGGAPIPMRHGLSIAEMARFLNASERVGCELHHVALRGYARELLWSDLRRPWLPTSPNLPRLEGVLCYPGQVMVEGTELSEGRGTTTPFEVLGAPFIDPRALCEAAAAFGTPGITLRPYRFEPTFHKFEGQSCGGVFLHPDPDDPRAVRAYRTGLALLGAAHDLYPDRFAWRAPGYEYETEKMPIDILAGGASVRTAIDAGLTRSSLDALCAVDAAAWAEAVRPHLLYGAGEGSAFRT